MFLDSLTLKEARKKIEEIETELPMVFRGIGESDMAAASSKVIEFMIAKNGMVTKQEIGRFLGWKNISTEDLDKILLTLEEFGAVTRTMSSGRAIYKLVSGVQP